MGRIPEETVNQVLAATDIVALIGRSVKLRRAGTNWVGLCPFHNEKSPSFNVSPSRGTYHCFGCGAGGSAIRFVMEHDAMSFVEAVKRLGDAAGIRIEEEESRLLPRVDGGAQADGSDHGGSWHFQRGGSG
jgi:DNA primase